MKIKVMKENGTPVVSSRLVAKHFGKRHNDFIRDIEKVLKDIRDLGNTEVPHWFKESLYRNSNNRTFTEYLMTRDAFSLMIMPMTGRQALEWKLKYIEAFNFMEDQLDYNRARRIKGKHLSSLEQFANYSKSVGFSHASVHTSTFGDNSTALSLVASSPQSTEEYMDEIQCMNRSTTLVAEVVALNALSEGVRNGYPVPQIYELAIRKVMEYSSGQFKLLR